MTNAVSNALANRSEQVAPSPRKLVERYSEEFGQLLPSHVKADMFVRASAGALRTGKMTNGEFDLEIAARNNPQAFINALRTAARLGLTPGTEEYYLTPRKVGGRLEILGITGYMGYIELMYRAGAVATVIVETVHEGEVFDFVRGRDEVPTHAIDWRAKRGPLELVYAYAKLKNGSFSYVVVLNQDDIERIKGRSAAAKSDYSPWKTDERAMWLKSAVRQLRKWVPTSASYRTEQLRAIREAEGPGIVIPDVSQATEAPLEPKGHQVYVPDPDDVVDAELIPDPSEAAVEVPAAGDPATPESPPEQESSAEEAPSAERPVQEATATAEQAPAEPPAPKAAPHLNRTEQAKMREWLNSYGYDTAPKMSAVIEEIIGVKVQNLGQLSMTEATEVIKGLQAKHPEVGQQQASAPETQEPAQ